VKINEIIVENQIQEFGIKDLAKGFNKGTLGKSLGKGISKAGSYAADKIGQGAVGAATAGADFAKGWGQVGNRLAKQFVGKDPNDPWRDKNATPTGTPSYMSYGDDLAPTHNGEVFAVKVRGNEYFKSYDGRWYEKASQNSPNDFSVTHPLDAYKDYEVLNKELQQGNYEVVSVEKDPAIANRWIATGSRPANSNGQQQTGAGIVDRYGNVIK
jgi:hypothetical protein